MDPSLPASVIIVDAMAFRRAGLAALLEPWANSIGMEAVEVAPNELNADLLAATDPKFVVLNVGGTSLHATNPATWASSIRRILPDTPCLVLSDRTEPDEAILAARLGQQAFMPTSTPPKIALQVFAMVMSGGTYFPREALLQPITLAARGAGDAALDTPGFTPRQLQVLEGLRQGRANKTIARDLDMQESTVKVHVRQIMGKLGAANRTQAALLAARSGVGG
ncbi:MAG: hypothetical protein JWQ89_2485 [Devosia sp.]|uniref:helix-turn-helix transcriptional regulator n=1 Tax=Devosia sp. TaxID=1871048 RepID=UPI0026300889|nr:response regulator transcription factor [Devosia sp.]MDB5540758.1 hypothetical protein [Devosia sp.]